MFGYVGPMAGQEFIPYFLALLALVWAAAVAILQWPFFALMRLIRGRRPEPGPPPTAGPAAGPPAEPPPHAASGARPEAASDTA